MRIGGLRPGNCLCYTSSDKQGPHNPEGKPMSNPLAQLSQLITAAHNLEEPQALCFTLGVDWDELAGQTRSGAAKTPVGKPPKMARPAGVFAGTRPVAWPRGIVYTGKRMSRAVSLRTAMCGAVVEVLSLGKAKGRKNGLDEERFATDSPHCHRGREHLSEKWPR